MDPISRRRALQLGGLGLASAVLGGVGLTREGGSRFDPATGATLVEPPVLVSTAGTLRVRLEAAQGTIRVAGRAATTLGYNGGVPGPTLRLQPGDRLQVRLVNWLRTPTNLHVHGLHVSPDGNGDNPFVQVGPDETFDYDHQLPKEHPPGVYWYHPHHHGMVADQIYSGLYGAIIVGDADLVPVIRERMLVISDMTLDGTGRLQPPSTTARMLGREGDLILVNGQTRPRLTTRPGARERWRVVNACTSRYLQLRLDGQHLQLLGIDSGHLPAPRDVAEVVLAPGNRADLLVTTARCRSQLRTLRYNRGGIMGVGVMGASGSDGGMPGVGSGGTGSATGNTSGSVLATLDVTGGDVEALPAPLTRPPPRDLRGAAISGRRELTFAMGMGMGGGGMRFTIDGREFDPDRVDQTVRVGTVEEWTITNTSPMDHPLHLHVWPMQLIEQNGQPLTTPSRRDVVNIPARSNAKIRIFFDTFAGRSVYHCHILDHEDNGMMGVISAQ
ncbi:MAG: multicopper oxidase family protein [Frankiaceae bacterium]